MGISKEDLKIKGINNIIDVYDWFINKTNYKPNNYNMLNDSLSFNNIIWQDCIGILNIIMELIQIEIYSIYYYKNNLIIMLKI